MQILSASSSASSKCCELMIIDLPTFNDFISSHIYLLDSTSSPDVGSSRISTVGFVTIAIANDNFLFIPPESCYTNLSWCSVNITTRNVSSIEFWISLGFMFLISQINYRCSLAVNVSKSTSNYWQSPRFCWIILNY